jgi:hypothetical protein
MGIITKPKTWEDAENVNFDDLNSNFDTVYNEVNGNLDNNNIKAGAGIVGTKIATTLTSKHIKSSRWSGLYDLGVSGTSKTINWANGDRQTLELTGDVTISFSNPVAGQALALTLVQDGTGSRTITFPAEVIWTNEEAPTLTTDPAGIDVIVLYYNGTKYLSQAILNFG